MAILSLLAANDRESTAEQIRAGLPSDLTLRNVYYHLRILETTHLVVQGDGRYKLA